MSVKIRLTRVGAKHRPFYRIVVTDSRMPRDGRFIETVGTYDPLSESGNVKVDGELVKDWIKKGARPSDAVKHLLKRAGVTLEPPVTAKKAEQAVALEELRPQGTDEAEPSEQEAPPDKDVPTEAPPRRRATSKSPKPARKGATKKKKVE